MEISILHHMIVNSQLIRDNLTKVLYNDFYCLLFSPVIKHYLLNIYTVLFERLNKYGLCLSISKKYVVLDDIAKHFLGHAVDLVKSGKKFVYVVDNIDWGEKVHDMREAHQNKSVHAFATSMVFSRVSSDHLPDDGPQKDIKTCNVRKLVTMKEKELKQIHNRYKILVARVLIKKFPEFARLKT